MALYALIWLFLLLCYRIAEFALYAAGNTLPIGFFKFLFIGWGSDIIFWVTSLFVPGLLFFLFLLIQSRIAKIIFSAILLLFFVAHLLFISYFDTTLIPLGSDLFGYSTEEIWQTVGASGSLNMWSILLFLTLLLPVAAALYYIPKRIKLSPYIGLGILCISLFFTLFKTDYGARNQQLGSDFANSLVLNKSAYFYTAVQRYYNDPGFESDIYADDYLATYAVSMAAKGKFNYINSNYPFLHTTKKRNVLGPFFKSSPKLPDIVIILVEGLGRAFTNEGANLGNFTPFLDSLAGKSLYWKNFLSNGGRTFAVLPSILGSLPFAENGFLSLGEKMPPQLSLLNILSHNGYKTVFYYGGDANFDNMKEYIEANNTTIYDEKTFPKQYAKLPDYNGFTWGYGDRELYNFYLDTEKADTLSAPKLSVLLTVSSHSPFLINNEEQYLKLFEQRMDDLGLAPKTRKARSNYAKQYATIMYADHALQDFFKAYERRSDFKNTIFLITGDHRIPEIPLSTKIDRYHVPLIIYSTLLKKKAEIASISTHFDITPSLLNFLGESHNLDIPSTNAFMGPGLDTTRIFQDLHQRPLMQAKTEILDFVMDGYHLNGDLLFKLDKNMGETLMYDEPKKKKLQHAFMAFKRRNATIAAGNKLIPDSIYNIYGTSH